MTVPVLLTFATDAALRKSLHQLGGNTTTFLVSQRAASIRQADLILVLDDGQLAGKGNPSGTDLYL